MALLPEVMWLRVGTGDAGGGLKGGLSIQCCSGGGLRATWEFDEIGGWGRGQNERTLSGCPVHQPSLTAITRSSRSAAEGQNIRPEDLLSTFLKELLLLL